MMSTSQKHILLIDAVLWTEQYSAADPLRNPSAWFRPHVELSAGVRMQTLQAGPGCQEADLERASGVIISGSPRDAWSEDPVNAALCGLVERCRAERVPLLGVCYGHQILGRALGGVVARHPSGWELGNVSIGLTASGRGSALFADLPEAFTALQSHADAVLELPPGCELLAKGSHTEVQAFSYHNRLFGVQFHPETSPEILRYLWNPRREKWRGNIGFDLDARLESLQPEPAAARVIANFINHLVT